MYFPVWPLPCSLPSRLPCLVIICEFIPIHISSNETNLIMASLQPWIEIGYSLCGALWNNYSHCFTCFVCGVAGQKTYCFHCWRFKNKWKKKGQKLLSSWYPKPIIGLLWEQLYFPAFSLSSNTVPVNDCCMRGGSGNNPLFFSPLAHKYFFMVMFWSELQKISWKICPLEGKNSDLIA